MENKIVLVSGASGNLGSAVVNYFLAQEAKVIGLVHRASDKEVKDENYIEKVVDLLDEKSSETCIKEVIDMYGQVHIAVLTAGGFKGGSIEKSSTSELKRLYGLNFETAYNIVRPLLSQMKEKSEGKFFFITSLKGLDTHTGNTSVAYSLSKSLLVQLTNIVNADGNEKGVRAYCVAPSTIDTPQNRKSMPDADFSDWEKPEDIAEIIGHYAREKKHKPILVVKEELGLL